MRNNSSERDLFRYILSSFIWRIWEGPQTFFKKHISFISFHVYLSSYSLDLLFFSSLSSCLVFSFVFHLPFFLSSFIFPFLSFSVCFLCLCLRVLLWSVVCVVVAAAVVARVQSHCMHVIEPRTHQKFESSEKNSTTRKIEFESAN